MRGQLAFPLSVNDKASFDNFCVGHNIELVNVIQATVKNSEPKMVYFYGAQSSGKSHLLFAALRMAKEQTVTTSYISLNDSYVTPDMSVSYTHLTLPTIYSV